MALIGLETGDSSELAALGSGASIVSSQVRTGGYALLPSSSVTTTPVIYTAAAVTARFYLFLPSSNITATLFYFLRDDGSAVGHISVSTGAAVTAPTGGSTATGSTLPVGEWVRIESRYTQGSGSNAQIDLYVNGTLDATSNNGTSTAAAVRAGLLGNGTLTIDDFRSRDDSTLPGAGQIVGLRPNAAGDETNFTGTFADVDDDPVNDATGRTAPSSGSIPVLDNLTTVASVSSVNLAVIGVRANRSSGAGRTHFIRSKKSGGTAENSADLGLGTALAYYTFTPSTQPSTQGDVDAWQAGASQSAAGGRLMTYTELWMMVDYVPAAATTVLKDVIMSGIIPWKR